MYVLTMLLDCKLLLFLLFLLFTHYYVIHILFKIVKKQIEQGKANEFKELRKCGERICSTGAKEE